MKSTHKYRTTARWQVKDAAEGHKKIYIIDEVHMLTTEAFNALLKTLEEPPSHVIFILATTEPERIPMTILSRCQRYEFRRITSADIAARLAYVAEQEHIGLTKGAAHILAVQADGGMRDALSMLDQCAGNADGVIDETLVRDLLGLIGRDWLFSLADAVLGGQGGKIVKAVDDVIAMGKEPQVILTELLGHLRAIMLYQADSRTDTLAAYADSLPQLAAQAKAVAADRVFAILSVLQQALLTAKTSPTPRVAVEMGLLMASRTQGSAPEGRRESAMPEIPPDLISRLVRLEQAVFQQPQRRPQAEYIPLPEEDAPPAMEDQGVPFPEEDIGPVTPPPSPPAQASATPAKATVTEACAGSTAAAAAVTAESYQKIWQQMCDILAAKMKKPGVRSCVRTGRVVYMGGGEAVVAYKTDFLVKRANREDYYRFVDMALESILGSPYHMKGYLEGAPELSEYEKKKTEAGMTNLPAERERRREKTAEDPKEAKALREPALRPASAADMDPAERAVLEPLLKAVGDCNIYIEDKK